MSSVSGRSRSRTSGGPRASAPTDQPSTVVGPRPSRAAPRRRCAWPGRPPRPARASSRAAPSASGTTGREPAPRRFEASSKVRPAIGRRLDRGRELGQAAQRDDRLGDVGELPLASPAAGQVVEGRRRQRTLDAMLDPVGQGRPIPGAGVLPTEDRHDRRGRTGRSTGTATGASVGSWRLGREMIPQRSAARSGGATSPCRAGRRGARPSPGATARGGSRGSTTLWCFGGRAATPSRTIRRSSCCSACSAGSMAEVADRRRLAASPIGSAAAGDGRAASSTG